MPHTDSPTIDLNPILTEGPDCLDSHAVPALDKVTLRIAQLEWDTEFHSVVACSADNLFASPAFRRTLNYAMVKSARVTQATFDFYFTDTPSPRPLHVVPPATAKLPADQYAERIRRWLTTSVFCILPKAAICQLMFAICLAASPAAVPDDNDDDDGAQDRHPINFAI